MTIKKSFDKKTSKRFIAYFDIMGFKDYMYRNSHATVQKLFDKVSDVIKGLETAQVGSKDSLAELEVVPVMFSDTILLITKGDTKNDLMNLSIISLLF